MGPTVASAAVTVRPMETRNPDSDSERRQATVLFADVSGFTAMSEAMDPEDVTTAMNRCFEMLEAAVESYGGHVDKYIGDCVMALFGVPKAIEQAPRQAVNAAIEMRRRLYALNQERRLPVALDIHVGVNTGLVVAGQVGGATRRDFTVMGDTVNIASRLKDAAPKGAIWVGAATHRYTVQDFEYRNVGPQKVKGKGVPLVAYEVLSSTERRHRRKPARAGGPISSPLVGRDPQLEQLRRCVRHLLGGQGGIVTVTGDAGMGKSRLLAELSRQEEMRGVTLLEGRSLSVGQGLGFHPFADLLRHWAGILDDDGDHQALAKLDASVASLFGDGAADVFPFVATLMGLRVTGVHAERIAGIEGEAMETLIFKTVRDLLRRMAAGQPLVLVFEDVHWADLSSLKLLEFLLRLVVDTPVLFILALRPDHQPTSRRLLTLTRETWPRQLVEVHLQPLDASECETLIHNLLEVHDLSYGTRVTISRKAEGNPFFIEEVVRSLVDQGAIEHRHGRFRVTGKIESVVIPGTIQEVIMSRVDRLPDRPRRILQTASVIGRRFPSRILARVVDEVEQLQWALGHLKNSQLLEESGTGEDREVAFRHALIQEVVYDSILQKTRKDLHVAVARSIEALFGERLPEFYGMLAYHYSRAEDVERAEDYLYKAGDEAARTAAPSEALNYFREASRLYLLIHGEAGDPRKKALLERNIAVALFQTGNLTESIEHFDQALEHLGEPIPKTDRARTRRFVIDMAALLAGLYLPLPVGRRTAAREQDREVMQVRYTRARAQMTSDPKRYFFDTVGTLRRLGRVDPTTVDQACGMYAGGTALFAYSGISFAIGKRFLDIARGLVREGNVKDLFLYRSMQFVCDYLEGRWGDDRTLDEELVEEALRQGQVWDVFVYRGLNAERLAHRGEFTAAEGEIVRLRELSESYGFAAARSNEYAMSAVLEVERRRLAGALELIEAYYANQHEDLFHLFALATKAKIQILAGDEGAATGTLAAADDLVGRMGRVNVYHLSVHRTSRLLHDVAAVTALSNADRRARRTLVGRARGSARLALRISARVARERPEVYRLAGQLSWLLGRGDKALGWWRRSIDAAKHLGARPELARTYSEVGRCLQADPHGARIGDLDATACLEAGRRLFDELGLERDAEALGSDRGAVGAPLAS